MTHHTLLGKSRTSCAIRLAIVGFAFTILGASFVSGAVFQWQAIAASNTPAPGLPDGNARFSGGFGMPAIDESGHVTFSAALTNTSIHGAVCETGANAQGLSPVVYDNQPATGVAGAEYQIPRAYPALAGGGDIAFWIDLSAAIQGAHIASAIYGGDPQNPQLLMRSGQSAPGVPNATFRDTGPWDQFRASGDHVAFLTSASVSFGTGIIDGIWRATPGGASPELIVYSTMPTPNGSGQFDLVNLKRVTETGEVGFRANTNSGPSLWSGTPGNLHEVASGLVGPGTDNAILTRTGTWFFYKQSEQSAVRVRPDTSTTILATTGQQAPGLPNGVVFNGFGGFASGRDGNSPAFWNSLTGTGVNSTNDWAAYLYSNGSPRLIAREGNAAPGTAAGVVFDGTPIVYANDSKQFVMYYELTGPGVTGTNFTGLWCDVGDGQLQLLLRQGDNFAVNGATKVIREIEFNVNSPGSHDDRFNNAGQFVVGLLFTDNSSGVFTMQVPEPSAATFALLCPALLRNRRRSRVAR